MPDTVHLRADLNVAGDSISGSVQSPSGEPSVFDGWLGLISIIERAQASLGRQDARGVNSRDSRPTTSSDRRANPEGNQHDQRAMTTDD
jgi:hypothetical protein